ncbi:hypothetical protein FJTKL_12050 [Diaporthe vaccinii]|uniref:Uncharacterized protein n=1 Tax=Diaporthe vaccinii TaxID=105482 RepID=A0ABR4FB08_9PEZI
MSSQESLWRIPAAPGGPAALNLASHFSILSAGFVVVTPLQVAQMAILRRPDAQTPDLLDSTVEITPTERPLNASLPLLELHAIGSWSGPKHQISLAAPPVLVISNTARLNSSTTSVSHCSANLTASVFGTPPRLRLGPGLCPDLVPKPSSTRQWRATLLPLTRSMGPKEGWNPQGDRPFLCSLCIGTRLLPLVTRSTQDVVLKYWPFTTSLFSLAFFPFSRCWLRSLFNSSSSSSRLVCSSLLSGIDYCNKGKVDSGSTRLEFLPRHAHVFEVITTQSDNEPPIRRRSTK